MMHLLQQKDNNKVRICDCRIIKAWDVSVLSLFQLCFRERFFWLCAILFSTRITEICTERKDAPSNCTGPCPRSPPLVFHPASLSRHWALNCLRPSQQKRDISCFWGVRFFFLSLPATKRGRHSKAKLSCKAGTEEQVLTISPVFSVAPTLAATLHFSCNWNHISNTFTEMKQLRRSGVTLSL